MLLLSAAPRQAGLAATGIIELAQGAAHVGLERRLGDAFVLEIDHVKEAALIGEHRFHDLRERRRRHAVIGHREAGDGAHLVGMEDGCVPRDRRAPIVADEHRRLTGRQGVDDGGDIPGHRLHRIGLDRVRLVGSAIAAHIDGARGEAGGRERRHLVAV